MESDGINPFHFRRKKMCYWDDYGLWNAQTESRNWGLTQISNIFNKATIVESFMLVPLNEVYWCISVRTDLAIMNF